MSQYTVFGFYTDTGLRYCSHRDADSVEAAVQQVAELYPDESISIVAVVDGHHEDLLDGEYLEDTEDLCDGTSQKTQGTTIDVDPASVDRVVPLPPICWVSRPASVPELVRGIDEGFDYCPECVKVVAQEYRDKYPQYADDIIEDGGCDPLHFSESPASCGRCNCMLSCSIEVDGEQVYIETESDWYA